MQRRPSRVHARASARTGLFVGVVILASALLMGFGAGARTSTAAAPKTFKQVDGGVVTVSQTEDLLYQSIEVSWTKFRPTEVLQPGFPLIDVNRVWLMQCRGADPRRQDCLLGTQYSDRSGIPFLDLEGKPAVPFELGSSNEVFAATDSKGRGQARFEVRNSQRFPLLGCTSATTGSGAPKPTCSVVIVPAYAAGEPFNDRNWARRVTVPLSFAPTSESCDVRDPDAVFEGSPAAQRLFESWQARLCSQADRVDAVYVSGGEPGARTSFATGVADAALTLRPFEGPLPRPATYAPIAVSGIGVGFVVDDPFTGKQLTQLRLNGRMLAKVISQSYGAVVNNPATCGNPLNFGDDPELLALNPDLPEGFAALQTPIMLSGSSDLVYELTRWIDADPQARAFLDGKKDPYSGMRVNAKYRGIDLPVTQLELRDDMTLTLKGQGPSGGPVACQYLVSQDAYPLTSLSGAAAAVVAAESRRRLAPTVDQATGSCIQALDSQAPPGSRAVLAFVDTAQAAALRIPMAGLKSSTGDFVDPDLKSMSSALAAMKVNPDGVTRQVDHAKLPAGAYPLTVLTTALLPTSGLSTGPSGKAERVARVLDHAAGRGQTSGVREGDLPVGYVALTEPLRKLTNAAAVTVRAQRGAPAPSPTPTPTPTPSSSPSSSPESSGGTILGGDGAGTSGSPLPVAAPAGPAATSDATQAAAISAEALAQRRGSRTLASDMRWALPVLVAAASLAGIAGLGLREAGRTGSLVNRLVVGAHRRLRRTSAT